MHLMACLRQHWTKSEAPAQCRHRVVLSATSPTLKQKPRKQSLGASRKRTRGGGAERYLPTGLGSRNGSGFSTIGRKAIRSGGRALVRKMVVGERGQHSGPACLSSTSDCSLQWLLFFQQTGSRCTDLHIVCPSYEMKRSRFSARWQKAVLHLCHLRSPYFSRERKTDYSFGGECWTF